MMNTYLKPVLKKVEPKFGSSFVYRSFAEKITSQKPYWHYHPEIELVYIDEGEGKRLIGNHVSFFTNGDLILIGSNLPHLGFPTRLQSDNKEIVIQISESCFGNGFLDMVETSSIKSMFEKAKFGLSFSGETKADVGERLKSMQYMTSFEKLIELIKIFHKMSLSDEYEILNATGMSLQVSGDVNNRIQVIYDYVSEKFSSKISLDDVASLVHMTTPSFCRFFKKTTGKTFINFLNEFRVAHACKLISEDNLGISDIAFESGFQNISNFNRTFKNITEQSPSKYKAELKQVIG